MSFFGSFKTVAYPVSGPSGGGTTNHLVRWDTGTSIKDSSAVLDDSGNLSGISTLTVNELVALTTITTGDNLIILNDDVVGTPTEDAGVEVNRGSSTDARLLWNETTDRWEAGLVGALKNINAAGSTGYVQYVDSSGNFAADANFFWTSGSKLLTLLSDGLIATTVEALKLTNQTAATAPVQFQVSPALLFNGRGWKSGAPTGSQPVSMRIYNHVEPGASHPRGNLRIQSSINSGAYSTIAEVKTGSASEQDTAQTTWNGSFYISRTGSTSVPGTTDHLTFDNTSTYTILSYRFGGTVKGSHQVGNSGYTQFKAAGTQPSFNFEIGSSIGSTILSTQIYSEGVYSNYNGFFGRKVTAGSADINALSTLNTYGSFSAKGIRVQTATYTLAETETVVYADPEDSQVCTGTPTACNTYVSEGTCNAHSGAGCFWFAGSSCSEFNGTDEGTCEANSGCTWDTAGCEDFNNTDSSTCTDGHDGCSWDTDTCGSQGDQGACEAIDGCTWNFSDCHGFDGQSQATCEANAGCSWMGGDCGNFNDTDQSTCESGHTGCSWASGATDCHTFDSTDQGTCEANTGCAWDSGSNTCYGLCTGTYDEGSLCDGQYDTSCSGSLCTGTYSLGTCSGAYGAECQGTASCAGFESESPCEAEAGCNWVTGIILTLPTFAHSNTNNTSRLYYVKSISNGDVVINANSGDSLEEPITLSSSGEAVTLHNHRITENCSDFGDEGSCTAQSGCSWSFEDCSNILTEEDCNLQSGCSWTGSCTGVYNEECTGTYTLANKWFIVGRVT